MTQRKPVDSQAKVTAPDKEVRREAQEDFPRVTVTMKCLGQRLLLLKDGEPARGLVYA